MVRAVLLLSWVSAVVSSDDPACPNGECPGLGNLFYLPSANAKAIQTGGRQILKDAGVGTCASISAVERSSRKFFQQDSMESLVKSVSTDSSLNGEYSTLALTVKGSLQVLTGSSSTTTSSFHSTQLDVTSVTRVVDLLQSDACLGSESNFDEAFLARFGSLPLIAETESAEGSSWTPYVSFLEGEGSHIMTQQWIGSRFQQWESSTSSSSDIEKTLQVKACASVEGTSGTSGWSVSACSAYSSDEKQSALETSAQNYRLILGGTTETRAALTAQVDKTTLNAFIDSASEGQHAVEFAYKPVWETLLALYSTRCYTTQAEQDCQNVQRAYNLQAAYEGWIAVGCPKLETSNGHVYQQMVVSNPDAQFQTYRCEAAKTGCYSNDDCHIGGAFASQCYCYGQSCLETGDEVPGTETWRSQVRGSKSGGTYDGVNNACYYHAGVYCNCDKSWAGGKPDRQIYEQASFFYLPHLEVV